MASRISRLPSSDFEPELNKIGGLFRWFIVLKALFANEQVAWLRFTVNAEDFVRLGVRECWQ
jgi:hypothetical protein